MKKKLSNNSGFSIIEVLIGAVVFMLGFSILIIMLNNVFVKYSVKEMELSNELANELMVLTINRQDTIPYDSIIVRSDIRFKAVKSVQIDRTLAKITFQIIRDNSKNKIIELYNEFLITEKQ